MKRLTLGAVIASFFIAVSQIGLAVTFPINVFPSLCLLVIAIATHAALVYWEHRIDQRGVKALDKLDDFEKRIKSLEQSKNMERLSR